MTRESIRLVALVMFGAGLAGQALAADQALLGCWQGMSSKQTLPDGTVQANDISRCTMQYTATTIKSSCGKSTLDYSYRVVRPGTYIATITGHSLRPDLIGGTREYDYTVDADRLTIGTRQQTTVSASSGSPLLRTDSVSARKPC